MVQRRGVLYNPFFIYALSLIHFQKHETISMSSVNFLVYLDIGVLSYNFQQILDLSILMIKTN